MQLPTMKEPPPCFTDIRTAATDFQSCVVWHTSTIYPLRPVLMRLQWTLDGSAEGPDPFLRSCVRSLLDSFLFLNDIIFRYCSSVVDSCLCPDTPLLLNLLRHNTLKLISFKHRSEKQQLSKEKLWRSLGKPGELLLLHRFKAIGKNEKRLGLAQNFCTALYSSAGWLGECVADIFGQQRHWRHQTWRRLIICPKIDVLLAFVLSQAFSVTYRVSAASSFTKAGLLKILGSWDSSQRRIFSKHPPPILTLG